MFWVISVYFNIRNTLPKSGTFLLGHPVCIKEVKRTYLKCVVVDNVGYCFIYIVTNYLKVCKTLKYVYNKPFHIHLSSFICKGKADPFQTSSDPEGSRKLRFPDFMTTTQNGGKFVSLTHRPPLPPGNAPRTHFC